MGPGKSAPYCMMAEAAHAGSMSCHREMKRPMPRLVVFNRQKPTCFVMHVFLYQLMEVEKDGGEMGCGCICLYMTEGEQ
jgi:hypothetical protein